MHKLLYKHIPLKDGGYKREPVTNIGYKIVVVDECSMVPKELLQQLITHPVYILCLGDPGQLPPVNSNDDNKLLEAPHIFLDEIMRQAAESEIIQLTMKIRNDEPIEYMKGTEVQVIHKSELTTGMLEWADQVLCATNDTRKKLNMQMRQLAGIENNEPKDGDKVICLRNYWETFSDNENALVNGTIGYLRNPFKTYHNIFPYSTVEGTSRMPILACGFETDNEEYYEGLDIDYYMMQTGESILDWKNRYKMGGNKRTQHLLPYDFTYGYAITGHKSQGSEWDKVLVIEEKFPFDKEEHKRWLYTCCTRAAKKLVLVRKD